MRKALLLLIIPAGLTGFFALQQGNYVGAEGPFPACVNCHGDAQIAQSLDRFVFEEWDATVHAQAYDSASGFVKGTARCVACHTTGFDSTEANLGSDDFISWVNYASGGNNVTFDDSVEFGKKTNVQCEACHGPASDHTSNPGAVKPNTGVTAETCGTCHQDAHHPYIEEWQLSAHSGSNSHPVAFLQDRFRNDPQCSGCHTMQGFIEFIGETQADTVNIIPAVTGNYGDASLPLVCAACHDPHPAIQHDGQLRLPAANLCVKCHNPEDAQPPDTPHHATSSMWDGVGAVEFAGFTYRTGSAHQFVDPAASNKCITCHVFRTEGDFTDPQNPIPAAVGHTFEPRVEACGQSGCHASGLGDVGPFGPFDYKRRQTFTDSLTTVLRDILENVSSADSTTTTFAEAKFNLEFVEASGSHGVHNANYAQDILEATIQVSRDNFTIVAVEPVPGAEVPRAFALHQNYPNPFNPATVIEFEVPAAANVTLRVFNAIGQHIATLVDEQLAPNRYKVDFNATSLPSGLYFYQLDSGATSLTRKMLLVK